MKRIILTETQLKKLIEGNGDSKFLDGEDGTHAKSSEVGLGALISNEDGDMNDSKPHDTDSFAQMQSPQQWGAVGRRNTSNTI